MHEIGNSSGGRLIDVNGIFDGCTGAIRHLSLKQFWLRLAIGEELLLTTKSSGDDVGALARLLRVQRGRLAICLDSTRAVDLQVLLDGAALRCACILIIGSVVLVLTCPLMFNLAIEF